jgi:hypothetical protein
MGAGWHASDGAALILDRQPVIKSTTNNITLFSHAGLTKPRMMEVNQIQEARSQAA